MRPTRHLCLVLCALALALTGCSQVGDLVSSGSGGDSTTESSSADDSSGSADEVSNESAEGSATADGPAAAPHAVGNAVPAEPASEPLAENDGAAPVAVTSPGGLPTVEGRSLNSAFAHVPVGPNGVLAIDVAALWALYDAVYGDFGTAAGFERAQFNDLVAEALLESEMPEAIARGIRVTELRDLVAAVWADDDSVIVIANVEAVAFAPADGADAVPLFEPPIQIARRGDYVVMGFGIGFDAALADGPRFSPNEWQAGWDALPENPALMAFVPSLGANPGRLLRELNLTESSGVRRAAAAIRTDGAMGLAIDITDDAAIQQALGRMAATTEQFIGTARAAVPPSFAGWVEYLDLARRALLSQLTYQRSGTVSTLSVRAAECGVPIALPVLAGVLTAMDIPNGAGPNDGMADAPAWQNLRVNTADGCGPMAGPPPRIARSLSRLAPTDTTSGGMMVFWDVGGTLRSVLPTMGNLLPVALDHDEVRAALGDAPLGLAGLDDAEGSGAIYFEIDTPERDGGGVLVAHRGLQNIAPPPPNATAIVRDGLGFVVVSERLADRVDAPYDGTASWPRTIASLPTDTVFAFGADSRFTDSFEAPPIPAVQAVVDATRVAAVGITDDYAISARILVQGDAASMAAAIEPGLREFASAMLQSVDVDERRMLEPAIDFYIGMLEFGHDGTDIVTLDIVVPIDNPLVQQTMLTGIAAAIAIPAYLKYQQAAAFASDASQDIVAITDITLLGPPSVVLEAIREQAHTYYLTERMDADGKALPMQFPTSVGFAPSLEQIRDACATTGLSFVVNSGGTMYDAEGWQQLGVDANSPGNQHAVSFDSEGAGPNATYTITVRGDADCDGVYSMLRSTGSVVDGVPVAGPVTEIEPNE